MLCLQVHGPAQLPKAAFDALDFIAASDGEASRNRQNYLGRVHYIDAAFGRFVAQLEARDMYQNSIIAMSADNGGPLGSANNYPLKGGKHSVCLASIHRAVNAAAAVLCQSCTVHTGTVGRGPTCQLTHNAWHAVEHRTGKGESE